MNDLRFDADRVKKAIAKLKALLDQGQTVRVWLVHHDGFSIPTIQNDWRAHFLTIFGYSGRRFPYLDPWPSGSVLEYDGGMFSKRQIAFMGELTFDPDHLELRIGSPAGSLGVHEYKVIAGP